MEGKAFFSVVGKRCFLETISRLVSSSLLHPGSCAPRKRREEGRDEKAGQFPASRLPPFPLLYDVRTKARIIFPESHFPLPPFHISWCLLLPHTLLSRRRLCFVESSTLFCGERSSPYPLAKKFSDPVFWRKLEDSKVGHRIATWQIE